MMQVVADEVEELSNLAIIVMPVTPLEYNLLGFLC